MTNVDVIRFRGVKFRRYPDSERWPDRVYYTPGIGDRQKGVKRLHEEIWIDANGPIPPGCHIHHGDHDPLNNDIGNLVCMTGEEHREHHGPGWSERASAPAHLEHLENIRPLAAAWHSSPEGIAWHGEHGRRTWDGRPYVERICEQCLGKFLTRSSAGNERFCSNPCKSAWRRESGVDDVERTCSVCETPFMANKYTKTATCSRKCGATRSGALRVAGHTHCRHGHEYTEANTYWPPDGSGRQCRACKSGKRSAA